MNNNYKKIITTSKNNHQGGYTVLELLFYIVLFSILSLVVINAMITMASSFRETRVHSELMHGGVIMERITREIRQALDINTISATSLKLDTKDDLGADKTVEFLLSGTNIQLLENTALTGNMNTPNIIVTALSFTQVTTAGGIGVKTQFTIRTSSDAQNRTQDFYNTTVLRGNY